MKGRLKKDQMKICQICHFDFLKNGKNGQKTAKHVFFENICHFLSRGPENVEISTVPAILKKKGFVNLSLYFYTSYEEKILYI